MSQLQDYISKVKEETKGFSDIEKMRYVYINLGKKLNFDVNYSFGNSEKKKKVYYENSGNEGIEEALETNTAICKSISEIYAKVMQSLNVNMNVKTNDMDCRKLKHVYNYYIDENGNQYDFDLQQDMMNIKARMRTTHFGVETFSHDNKKLEPIVDRYTLEQIDKKIGYIDYGTKYYTDNYIELIKMPLPLFDTINQKMEFILEHSDGYIDDKIGYADRKWRMDFLLGKDVPGGEITEAKAKEKIVLLDKKDSNKVEIFNCYKGKKADNNFILGVAVYGKDTDIYLFNEDESKFEKYTLDKFASKIVDENITPIEKIKGLGKKIKENKEYEK